MSAIPSFLSLSGNSYIYNGDGQFLFFIPEDYFADTKNPTAQVIGQYVQTLGVIDWALMDENGKVKEIRPFKLPTVFNCKPASIEKIKNFKAGDVKEKDCRVLHFNHGDEIISNIHLPQMLDNVEAMFKTMVINGDKIPHSVPYDKLHEYFEQAMQLNGDSFNMNMQVFGILISKICRDKNDLSKPFRMTPMNNMNDYQQISVKLVPKFVSPYVALTSENFDESIMASVLLSSNKDADATETPLEKVMTN